MQPHKPSLIFQIVTWICLLPCFQKPFTLHQVVHKTLSHERKFGTISLSSEKNGNLCAQEDENAITNFGILWTESEAAFRSRKVIPLIRIRDFGRCYVTAAEQTVEAFLRKKDVMDLITSHSSDFKLVWIPVMPKNDLR
jgi:hypothetical protein